MGLTIFNTSLAVHNVISTCKMLCKFKDNDMLLTNIDIRNKRHSHDPLPPRPNDG